MCSSSSIIIIVDNCKKSAKTKNFAQKQKPKHYFADLFTIFVYPVPLPVD